MKLAVQIHTIPVYDFIYWRMRHRPRKSAGHEIMRGVMKSLTGVDG